MFNIFYSIFPASYFFFFYQPITLSSINVKIRRKKKNWKTFSTRWFWIKHLFFFFLSNKKFNYWFFLFGSKTHTSSVYDWRVLILCQFLAEINVYISINKYRWKFSGRWCTCTGEIFDEYNTTYIDNWLYFSITFCWQFPFIYR